MKKLFVLCVCVLFLMVSTASAEYVFHSGKRGTGDSSYGKLGDSTHVWKEAWVNEMHFPKRIAVPLASVFCDGGNDADDASTPTLTEHDGVGALVYDSSAETTGFQFNWSPSSGYVSGMQVELVISSSVADGTEQSIDWSVFIQDTATAFGTELHQAAVAGTQAALNTKNDVITLTLDDTVSAAITAGSTIVTVEVWNASSSNGTTEIKAITIIEP